MAIVTHVLIMVSVLTPLVKPIRGGRSILVVQLASTEWISPTEEMEQVRLIFKLDTDELVVVLVVVARPTYVEGLLKCCCPCLSPDL